ncbi:hypothetical protein M430DRAFT_21159 [Amorphotheca resinae ATCC 22711]|uniref:Uncharacterized protein n=1 Tax=Amorphotheca resinae ATCC 22711 TaxID=857342 RepID=A0A2T3AX88_AMORE|nr:hypothetical protein M430DRAFT_21159 [Amorphotheca resinae ATCC 22711]PSS13250.1 hypothetical protein M430DRAFT_21159 [Amorphotheca resinae ATCC 22711]
MAPSLALPQQLIDMSSWFSEKVFSRLPSRFFSKPQLYAVISDEEGSFPGLQEPKQETSKFSDPPAQSKTLKILILLLMVVVFVSELFFVILYPLHAHSEKQFSTPPPRSSPSPFASTTVRQCGDSADAARSLDCKFDYLTISWETPGCYHPDIVESFLAAREWKFYEDPNGTAVSSWDVVSSGSRRYNVPWDWHFTHCMYTWRMMQTAVLERRALPDNILAFDHTRHCMEVVRDRRWDFEELHTLVHVKWPKCMPYEEWGMANFVDPLRSKLGII